MKLLHFSVSLLSLLFISLFTVSSFAQDQPKDPLFYIHEEVARIDKIDQYNSTSKDFTQMMADSKLDVPWIRASQTDDLHFYYLVPLKNYGDIDNLSAAFNSMMSKADKDKMNKLMSENAESIQSVRELVFKRSNSLSYDPGQDQGLDMSKSNFIHWDYYTVKSGKMKDMLDLGAKYKKLCEDKKIPTPYGVWLADMGENDNLIVVTTLAKDAVSFYQQSDKDNAALGDEGENLWKQMMPLLAHFEHKNGHTRPDLSYMKSK
jgi:hypothetical protein